MNIISNGIEIIPVEAIREHPQNPRKDLGDLKELTASIKEKGILQNITVVEDAPGEYTVVIGHRRLAAAKAAGLRTVPAIVAEMDEKEQIQTMLIENMQRADLTAYEQAQGFQMMWDFGDDVKAIAEKTGFSQTTVRHRLKMAELNQSALKKATEQGITFEILYKLEGIEDLAERNQILGMFGEPGFGWNLQSALDRQKNAKLAERARAVAEELGIPEYEGENWYRENNTAMSWSSDGFSEDAVREWFRTEKPESPVFAVQTGYFLFRIGTAKQEEDEEEDTGKNKEFEERKARIAKLESAAETALAVRQSYIHTFGPAAIKKMIPEIVDGLTEALKVQAARPYAERWSEEDKKTLEEPAENDYVKLLELAHLSFHDRAWSTWDWQGAYKETPDGYEALLRWMEKIGYKISEAEKGLAFGGSDLYFKEEEDGEE